MNTWSSITKTKFQHSFEFSFFFLITFLSLLLIFFNDIELNPSPMNDSPNYKFSISDCNLNSIAAQKNCQNSQLEAYTTRHGHDLICLYGTLLDSATSIDFNDLPQKDYNLYRVDDL